MNGSLKIKSFKYLGIPGLVSSVLLMLGLCSNVAEAEPKSGRAPDKFINARSEKLKYANEFDVLRPDGISFNGSVIVVRDSQHSQIVTIHSDDMSILTQTVMPPDRKDYLAAKISKGLFLELTEKYGQEVDHHSLRDGSIIAAFNHEDDKSTLVKLQPVQNNGGAEYREDEVIDSTSHSSLLTVIHSFNLTEDERFLFVLVELTQAVFFYEVEEGAWNRVSKFTNPPIEKPDYFYQVSDAISFTPINEDLPRVLVCSDRFLILFILNQHTGKFEQKVEFLVENQSIPLGSCALTVDPETRRTVYALSKSASRINKMILLSAPHIEGEIDTFSYDESNWEQKRFFVSDMIVTDPNQKNKVDRSNLIVTFRLALNETGNPFVWDDNVVYVSNDSATDLIGNKLFWKEWKLVINVVNSHGQNDKKNFTINVKSKNYIKNLLSFVMPTFGGLAVGLAVVIRAKYIKGSSFKGSSFKGSSFCRTRLKRCGADKLYSRVNTVDSLELSSSSVKIRRIPLTQNVEEEELLQTQDSPGVIVHQLDQQGQNQTEIRL